MKKTDRKADIERIIADAKKDGKIITAATAGKILDKEIEDAKTEPTRKPKADKKEKEPVCVHPADPPEGWKPAKRTEAKKDEAPKADAKKEKKDKDPKPEKMTKKACVIEVLNRKNGGTLDEMANLCVERGLGPFDRARATSALWLGKIGFEIEKDDKGIYKKKV